MTLTPELLQAVAAWVNENAGDAHAPQLRRQFPGVMFTECGEDDVPARLPPALETPRYFFFLFTNTQGHCLEFTRDLAVATGIVVAERGEDSA
jgi:hypothetical protein